MHSGYLLKRSNPHGSPPLQKTFCVLWGTHLMDFDSEEDAKYSLAPKGVLELIGVSEWDIEPSSFQQYANNFLVVTHTGGTYYLSATTPDERDIWMLKIKGALECMFANSAVIGFKPTKHFQTRPKPIPILPIGTKVNNSSSNPLGCVSSEASGAPAFCAKTGTPLPPSHTIHCPCCGQYYSSQEHINELSTAIQIQIEEAVKMCSNCKSAQCCLIWMKNMCYIHIMHLHELTPSVQTDIKKFKSSFKLRRRESTRLDMAAQLLEQQNISPLEFEELRQVDSEYRLETVISEGDRIQATLELLGNDMQTMISLLMSSSAADATGRLSFYQVILKIMSLADSEPDLIDFYFPQLVQVHFLESKSQTKSALTKVDLLQQALLAISAKYPALSLRLAWILLGVVGDYNEKRIETCQYAAAMVLLLQLELVMTGNVSCLVPAHRQELLLKQQDAMLYGENDVIEMPPLLTPATIDTAIASIHDESGGTVGLQTPSALPDYPVSSGSPMTPSTGSMFRNVATPVPAPNECSIPKSVAKPETCSSTPPKICRQLTSVFKAAEHQQETLTHDLRALFRLRYSLYEAEAKVRYARDIQKARAKAEEVKSASSSSAKGTHNPSEPPGASTSISGSPSVGGKSTVPHSAKSPKACEKNHAIENRSNQHRLSRRRSSTNGDRATNRNSLILSDEDMKTGLVSGELNALHIPDMAFTELEEGGGDDHSDSDAATESDSYISDGSDDERDSGFGNTECSLSVPRVARPVVLAPVSDAESASEFTRLTMSNALDPALPSSTIGARIVKSHEEAADFDMSLVAPPPNSCLSHLLSIGIFYCQLEKARLDTLDQLHRSGGEDAGSQRSIESNSSTSINSNTISAVTSKPTSIAPHENRLTTEVYYIWLGFADQLDFMYLITEIVEHLRFVDRSLRAEVLKAEMEKLCRGLLGGILNIGYDPTTSTTEPRYRIINIPMQESRVFRTKARAPSLLVCVVRRDDDDEYEHNSYTRMHSIQHTNAHHNEIYSAYQTLKAEKKESSAGNGASVKGGSAPGGVAGVAEKSKIANDADVSTVAVRGTPPCTPPAMSDSQSPASFATSIGMSGAPTWRRARGISCADNNAMEELVALTTNTRLDIEHHGSDSELSESSDQDAVKNRITISNVESNTSGSSHQEEGVGSDHDSPVSASSTPRATPTNRKRCRSGSADASTTNAPVIAAAVDVLINNELVHQTVESIRHNSILHPGDGDSSSDAVQFSSEQKNRVEGIDSNANTNDRDRDSMLLTLEGSSAIGRAASDANLFGSKPTPIPSKTSTPTPPPTITTTGMIERQPSSILSANRKGSIFGAGVAPDQMSITDYINTLENHVDKSGRPAIRIAETSSATATPSPPPPAEEEDSDTNSPLSGSMIAHNRETLVETLTAPFILTSTEVRELEKDQENAEVGRESDSVFVSNCEDGTVLSTHVYDDYVAAPSPLPDPAPPPVSLQEVSIRSTLLQERALKLYENNRIDESEYYRLINSDLRYHDEAVKEEAQRATALINATFGELWSAKKKRLLGNKCEKNIHDQKRCHMKQLKYQQHGGSGAGGYISKHNTPRVDNHSNASPDHQNVAEAELDFPMVYYPLYDVRAFIIKSNDDLRQEVCCLQVMTLFREIFHDMGISKQLWLKPYRIISTGNSTGIVEAIPNTMSLDGLKKTPGFTTLSKYYAKTYSTSPERLAIAKKNFISSLAAYSLFCYIMQIKDRHNGNILIDTDGHVIHIDFGFILSIAPGGTFSLETAPFKLTEEMVSVLDGGLDSELFGEFVKAFTAGFLALKAHAQNIISTVKVLAVQSPFPCFTGKDHNAVIEKLRGRFRTDLNTKETVQYCLDLIVSAYGNYGTRQYDSFQWYTNGIAI